MRPLQRRWAVVLSLAWLGACGGESTAPAPAQIEAATAAAARACDGLQKELVAALGDALGKGGPVAAIEVCQLRAPQIAASVGAAAGLEVGRTALRLRSPANAPDAWERGVLADFQQKLAEGKPAEGLVTTSVESAPDGHWLRYMRAIELKPVCLTCHGDELLPELREELARRYPADEATGFRTGDLRGAFTVTVKLDG